MITLSASPLSIEESPENDRRKRLEGAALIVQSIDVGNKAVTLKKDEIVGIDSGRFSAEHRSHYSLERPLRYHLSVTLLQRELFGRTPSFYKLERSLRCSGSFSAEHGGWNDL